MTTDPAAAPLDGADNPNVLVMGTIGGGKSHRLYARLERLDSPPAPAMPAAPITGERS